MNKYDQIEVVEKGVDEIEVVEKFNPFHDSKGRFSNKNGFASYSANPNTRAGAMAIARSAAAGHMNTVNVHRDAQATGATIRANANWLGQGHQQTRSQTGAATLNRRVEPAAGLAGASATGASWQYQNAQQGRKTNPGKQPAQQQQPQKPAPAKQTQQQAQNQQTKQQPAQQQQQAQPQQRGLADHVKNVQLRQGDKLAIVPRNYQGRAAKTSTVANNHDQGRVAGKDISDTVNVRSAKLGSGAAIDKIARAQGWNKAPTVTDDLDVFQKAVKQSGQLLIRSVNDGGGKTAQLICKETMTIGDAPLGGNGGKWYGSGMYCVGAKTNGATGRNLGKKIADSQSHSFCYGDTQMLATVHPSAKIATPKQANQLQSEYMKMSPSKKARYGGYGEYIASKGYDGAQWHDDSHANPYITMYNKSAMIFYGGVSTSI